jgi:ribonuclease Z
MPLRVPDRNLAMRPLLHPSLVNGRSGDPAVYIETLFEGAQFCLTLATFARFTRKIQRLEYVFVSHTHIDHFRIRSVAESAVGRECK